MKKTKKSFFSCIFFVFYACFRRMKAKKKNPWEKIRDGVALAEYISYILTEILTYFFFGKNILPNLFFLALSISLGFL